MNYWVSQVGWEKLSYHRNFESVTDLLRVFLFKDYLSGRCTTGEAHFIQASTLAVFLPTLRISAVCVFNFAQVVRSGLGSRGYKHSNICPSQDNYFIKSKLQFIQ